MELLDLVLRVSVGGVELQGAVVGGKSVRIVVQELVAFAEVIEGLPGPGVGVGRNMEHCDRGLRFAGLC